MARKKMALCPSSSGDIWRLRWGMLTKLNLTLNTPICEVKCIVIQYSSNVAPPTLYMCVCACGIESVLQ